MTLDEKEILNSIAKELIDAVGTALNNKFSEVAIITLSAKIQFIAENLMKFINEEFEAKEVKP